jgi:hypothetical protein
MNGFNKSLAASIHSKPESHTRRKPPRSAIIVGLLFGAFAALTAAQETGTPSKVPRAAADTSSVSGTWKGVYFIYPNLMGTELNLSTTSGGAISGILKYYPAVKLRSAFGDPKQGSYHVSGQYDERSRSFLLTPGAWIEKPDMAGAVAPIAGVLDARANEVAGIFEFPSAPNPVFFILAPETGADKLIAEITGSAYPAPLPRQSPNLSRQDNVRLALQRQLEQIKNMPHPPGSEQSYKALQESLEKRLAALPGGDVNPTVTWAPPPVDRLLDWASRLKQEMPALDLRNTVMEKIYLPARNLFADDYFKDHFGLTYEEMDTAQRKAVAGAFSQHGRELSGYDFLARPFQNAGDFGAPDITVSIRWQGIVRSWARDLQTSFPAMPAEVNSFSEMNVAEAAANTELPFLWPSEKEKFNSALTGARTRLADPVLTLLADQLITTANGNAGARELAAWRARQTNILQYASTTEQAKLQQRIDARLDQVLGQLVASDIRSLATLGHGIDAVVAGNRWCQQVEKSYDFALTRPPIVSAIRQFDQDRAKNLTEAKAAIIAQIDAAAQDAQVKSILDNNLRCPSDAGSEVATALRQHADQRLAVIQHQQFLGLFSGYERGLMVPRESGHLDLSRADTQQHMPQPDELRLALLRGMAFGTGKVLGPHTAKVSTLFGAASMIVTISDPTIVQQTLPQRPLFWKERQSWIMVYQVDMRFSLPDHDALWDADPNLRRGAQMAVDTVNATAALLSQEKNEKEFRLYDDGWGVPDLRQQGAAGAGLEALLKGMMKQR